MGSGIPKRGGEFSSYIDRLKGKYLEKRNDDQNAEELMLAQAKKRQLFDTMTISDKDRERMKRELCRMEAKRIQLELDGKTSEVSVLHTKIKLKKAVFKKKYGKLKG
ncbi:MAG: hypothetical protein LBS33_00975 [Streptococcaceae bacterium]|jgi:hypothetical protein|nr:hypothetical protein [Streptococcaceae bacterium]